ncbi:glycosyltransferase [Caulobacter segnis]|uniref:Glycosyltransferase n=1 Tax=Caulobacter segnis TaxID=88688 RepID=A0A2W5V4J8_9CAUL|nr:glycosyltransferase [Caulobacter segnis]PZR34740.1 MAG: glycosyltransferase [Caulobacter segnis]
MAAAGELMTPLDDGPERLVGAPRVLTFLHSFEPGGVERIALRLVRRWRARGVDAPLFVGRAAGDMRGDVGADLAFVSPPHAGRGVAKMETLWMIWTLPQAVRRLRPDVLFCAGNTYAVVAVALKCLLGRACPPILLKVSNDLDRQDQPGWFRFFYRLWLKAQGRHIDHFIGMETPMTDEIEEGFGVPDERITIIPDPALSKPLIEQLRSSRPPARADGAGRRFVGVARLTAQKNIALMLGAFERGARNGDTLTLIGEGPERGKLERLVQDRGLDDRVVFLGYHPEPATLLPAFDIFLLSSDYEGVPAVILEALAAGLPIVATDCSRSMRTLLGDGALGQLVAVGDEAALADAIARAKPGTQDDHLSLRQAERFTLEDASEAYLEVIARLRSTAAQARLR